MYVLFDDSFARFREVMGVEKREREKEEARVMDSACPSGTPLNSLQKYKKIRMGSVFH